MTIPTFVTPGFIIEYVAFSGDVEVDVVDQLLAVSAQSATVHEVDEDVGNPETVSSNETFTPGSAGAWQYQFWVDPSSTANAIASIHGADGETYQLKGTEVYEGPNTAFDGVNATVLQFSDSTGQGEVVYQTSTGLILEKSQSYVGGTFVYYTYAVVAPNTPLPKASGNVDEWILSNGKWSASAEPGSISAGYAAAAVGYLTGGTTEGILWYNSSTGDVSEWEIANGGWAGSIDLGAHPGGWQIAGAGDFFGNGTDDVLWTSNSNGQVLTDIWELSNGKWAASVSPGSHPGGYQVAGIGTFTSSGTSDILWENPTTGDVDEWLISNGKWAGSIDLGSHPGSGWQIAGVGDFFGTNTEDVLWTNSSGGPVQTDIWQLGPNGQWMSSVSPGTHPAGYQVAGIGDFAGNGTDGILWQNPTTGDVDEWLLSKGNWAGSVDLGGHPGSNWQIAGVGDFIGTRTSDILWQQT